MAAVHFPRCGCALLAALLLSLTAAPARAQLYWTQYIYDAPIDRFSLHRANPDGSGAVELNRALEYEPFGGLSVYDGKVLWSTELNQVYAATLEGTELGPFTSPLPRAVEAEVRGWAFDPLTGATFRAGDDGAGGSGNIERVDADGSVSVVLPTEPFAWDMAVAIDPANRKLYFGGYTGGRGVIRRANLDGTGAEDLIPNLPMHARPFDLALDVAGGKMYFTADIIRAGKIQRANLDGSGLEDLVTGIPPSLVAVVPEPGAAALLLFAAAPALRRRRNARSGSYVSAEDAVAAPLTCLDR